MSSWTACPATPQNLDRIVGVRTSMVVRNRGRPCTHGTSRNGRAEGPNVFTREKVQRMDARRTRMCSIERMCNAPWEARTPDLEVNSLTL